MEKKEKLVRYHSMLDEEMIADLAGVSQDDSRGALSRAVVRVLELLYPGIDNEHFFGVQRGSRYELVNDDLSVERVDIYINIPEKLYKKLKLMHQDLNVYSIAQLVRGFLRGFLFLVKRFGSRAWWILKALIIQWQKENMKVQLSSFEVSQLCKISGIKAGEVHLFTGYNEVFVPLKINRC